MGISVEKAYDILNLPLGASKDAIEKSYKKLASKWHPEKYASNKKNTREAIENFNEISMAYKKLISTDKDFNELSLYEMFDQYRQVFKPEKKKMPQADTNLTKSNQNNNVIRNNMNATNRANMAMGQLNLNHQKSKLQQNYDEKNSENNPNLARHALNSNNLKAGGDDSTGSKQLKTSHKQKAKSCAMKGNEYATSQEFDKAIEKFTEAIKYDPNDHRLYGNRSFCYEKLSKYQEALEDAETAISIDLEGRKGYYRKGRALMGLKRYREAEQAFLRLFDLDESVEPELENELTEVRVLQLQEMGFSRTQSENAFKRCSTIEEAIAEILKFDSFDNSKSSSDQLKFYSSNTNSNYSDGSNEDDDDDDDDASCDSYETSYSDCKTSLKQENNSGYFFGVKHLEIDDYENNNNYNNNNEDNDDDFKLVAPPSKKSNSKDKNKPSSETSSSVDQNEIQSSLWVGNVDPSVSEKELIELFSPFGQLLNVRCLPEKYCAFVNYKTKDEASKAMQSLQGKQLESQKLLIKYPDNPNSATLNTQTQQPSTVKTSLKPCETINKKTEQSLKQVKVDVVKNNDNQQLSLGSKLTGPVNGNECYFWRTTGCIYADKCRYEHIKKNKGIDKKPWHKN